MLRGKESSNRIELSRLVQDLLNFGVWGSLWLWGGGRWVGVSPHACTCTCTHMYIHVYMYRKCKWPPTWRHPCLACLSCSTCVCMHTCACMCMCVCMGHPPIPIPTPIPIHPSATPQGGEPPESVKIR